MKRRGLLERVKNIFVYNLPLINKGMGMLIEHFLVLGTKLDT
jgi:hypothetical protein